ALSKPQIALELLDRVRGEGLPGWAVVADAGYGASGDFRDGLQARGLSYIVGVTEDFVAFTQPPLWQTPDASVRAGGRPRSRPPPAPDGPHPTPPAPLAKTAPLPPGARRRRAERE